MTPAERAAAREQLAELDAARAGWYSPKTTFWADAPALVARLLDALDEADAREAALRAIPDEVAATLGDDEYSEALTAEQLKALKPGATIVGTLPGVGGKAIAARNWSSWLILPTGQWVDPGDMHRWLENASLLAAPVSPEGTT